jgi:pimeloyl-ACP methyl ester carboxylesterase
MTKPAVVTEDASPAGAGDAPSRALSRLLLEASIANDLALRTALASVLSGAYLRGTLGGFGRHDRERLEFYAQLADRADPLATFATPPSGVEVGSSELSTVHLPGGAAHALWFDSPYATVNPDVSEEYARHARNRKAGAQHWRHDDGPRQTLCVIHGFGASPAWFNAVFFSLRSFFAEGWDVLLFTLPFHGHRRGSIFLPGGVQMFEGGAARLHEAILQAVFDLRILLAHIRGQGAPRVGITGISLGGYVTALMAAIDSELAFAIPNSPVVWMGDLLSSWIPANAIVGVGRRLLGVSQNLMERASAVHSPLTYPPVVPRERLMIVYGEGDRVAPPQQSELLREHWGHPAAHRFAGSHVLHFGRRAYLDEMRELMAAAAARPLKPRRAAAPSRGSRAAGAA